MIGTPELCLPRNTSCSKTEKNEHGPTTSLSLKISAVKDVNDNCLYEALRGGGGGLPSWTGTFYIYEPVLGAFFMFQDLTSSSSSLEKEKKNHQKTKQENPAVQQRGEWRSEGLADFPFIPCFPRKTRVSLGKALLLLGW